MSAPPKIHIENVCKSFGPKDVLTGIDLDVMQGESVVIIGGSGTGKSVLLKCILGILTADSGIIEVEGQDVNRLTANDRDDVNRKFGMLFQSAALFDSLPVWENVAFGLMQGRHMGRDEAKAKALETLGQVGLAKEVGELSPAELSGGMQKRVGLARAIAGSPEVVFFDEPTTGLDPIMADVINDLIITCVKDQGITALSITHDMASARKISDRIAMLHHGKLIWIGSAGDVDSSGNGFVDQFVNGRAEGPIKMELRR
ncbi:MAG: ATP-binding cassette domain-containing protein [Rhodospirillaceae bacterium]|jgi:phospholipid/cholesterol/gamma-HCH transport system ATP-binding protein|nr:ATP-binding cassette domain-containing protein [Rhodospirillaceae bacterium]